MKPTKLPTFDSISNAMDAVTTVKNRRRVVATSGAKFVVCSVPAAYRLRLPIVARNYC